MKTNYVVIPLITVIVAVAGSLLTSHGMDWYATIQKPSFTPPGSIIGAVWTFLYVLATISAVIVWNSPLRNRGIGTDVRIKITAGIFMLNAILNVLWSYIFFTRHQMYNAFVEAIALDLTVLILIMLTWRISKIASTLLIPYALWVAFASFLTWSVWVMNI
jgi:tryptophan-rich sensory protein